MPETYGITVGGRIYGAYLDNKDSFKLWKEWALKVLASQMLPPGKTLSLIYMYWAHEQEQTPTDTEPAASPSTSSVQPQKPPGEFLFDTTILYDVF